MKSRSVIFSPDALGQLQYWQATNAKFAGKIIELLKECLRTPFDGKGKPEPLKGDLKGYWSRRIDQEHRLIYRVDDSFINVFSCKGHYE